MLLHQILDRLVQRPSTRIQLCHAHRILSIPGTLIQFLPRNKFSVHEESMLQIVDSQVRRLAKIHGAKMSGHFRSALVCRRNRRTQLRARNEHVSLKVIDALVEPEIHRPRCILRPRELVHLNRPRPFALKIRPSHVHLRSGSLSRIDGLLEFEIRIRFERARGSNRGHAARQVQSRKAVSHLSKHPIPHRIKHVVVHPHQPRDHAVPMQIQSPARQLEPSPTTASPTDSIFPLLRMTSDPHALPHQCHQSRAHGSAQRQERSP